MAFPPTASGFSRRERILLYFVIALGLSARAFNFLVLPESALADAPFHVLLAKQFFEWGTIPAILENTFMRAAVLQVAPLYYILEAALSAFTGLPLDAAPFAFLGVPLHMSFARILPLIFTALVLLLSLLLFRKLFPNLWLLPFAFVSVFPWSIRYGAVNYPENLFAVLLLAALVLALRRLSAQSGSAVAQISSAAGVAPAPAGPGAAGAAAVQQKHSPAGIPAAQQGETKFAALVALFPVLAALAIVKTFTPLVAGVFALALAALLFRRRERKSALAFALFGLLLFSPMALLFMPGQGASQSAAEEAYGERYAIPETSPALFALDSFASYFDFPPEESFARVPLLSGMPYSATSALFSIVLLPLAILMLLGIAALCSKSIENRSFYMLALMPLLLVLAIALWTGREVGFIFMRPLVPLFTICAAFLGLGFAFARCGRSGFAAAGGGSGAPKTGGAAKERRDSTLLKKISKIALASLFIYAFYSLAYTSASALYFSGVYNSHAPLYAEISKLPDGVKVHNAEKGRAIGLYTGKPYDDIPGLRVQCIGVREEACVDPSDPAEVAEALRANNFTHIAVSCYRSPWEQHPDTLRALERSGAISPVYSDSCASLYEIAG